MPNFPNFDALLDAVDESGLASHDVGYEGLIAIIEKWEEIKTRVSEEDLLQELIAVKRWLGK